jgi:hypothetical protein
MVISGQHLYVFVPRDFHAFVHGEDFSQTVEFLITDVNFLICVNLPSQFKIFGKGAFRRDSVSSHSANSG